jgi:c-di-GMP-binding flagellar brake protein YcgR
MATIKERRRSPRINCYSRSIDDENVEHGIVVDISETGACLLILKGSSLFKYLNSDQEESSYGSLRLNIFHPDLSLEDGLNIKADIARLDNKYSKDRLKLGVNFTEMDADKSNYVSEFIGWMHKKDNYFLHSEVEICL